MQRLALIPARGGSKRLPRKNIVDFHGHPIIAYTIRAAQQAGLFDSVTVSTEDDEIAAVALRYGAEVEWRDPPLAEDRSRIADVAIDLLDSREKSNRNYDVLCVLYATAPLRNAADIRSVVALIQPDIYHYSMAVTNYGLQLHQAMRFEANGQLHPLWPIMVAKRPEETECFVLGNGSTYAVWVKAFRASRDFYGPKLRGYMMPRSRSADIDTEEDLELARFYGEKMIRSGELSTAL
jgi:pseudaminic acid cytidylyltransferase